MSWRQAGLWYPHVPPKDLWLNEGSFTGQDPLRAGYRPLVWTHFGGQRGKYLQHIVGLFADYLHRLHFLEFVYSDAACQEGMVGKLGRGDSSDLPSSSIFVVDGAAGERIESVEVGLYQSPNHKAYEFLKHGIPKYIKVRFETTLSFYNVHLA